jgi:hypothetical protein
MRTAFFILPLLLVAPALAQDTAQPYPFSGFFGTTDKPEVPADAMARCAIAFFDQREDGSMISYVPDFATFDSGKGPLAYQQFVTGQCTYDPETKIEACTTRGVSDLEPITSYDVIHEIGDDLIKVAFADHLEQAHSIAAMGTGGIETYFYRCPFDVEVVAAALTANPSPATVNEWYEMQNPSAAYLNTPQILALTEAVSGK